jgi:glycosyltransferase involved in cell wall biosynthesis
LPSWRNVNGSSSSWLPPAGREPGCQTKGKSRLAGQNRPEDLFCVTLVTIATRDVRGQTVADKQFPKITVVTPSYKSAGLIEHTIQSVLSQKYPNLEYIIIDGAGDTATAEVIRRFEQSLSYWRSERDNGQYDAINKGFLQSTGDILCWLNADDMLLPRSLFVVADVFSSLKEVSWISTLQPGIWDANSYLAGVGRIPGFSRDAFLDGLFLPGLRSVGYWIQQESTFWTRELWRKAGSMIPSSGLAGDFSLWAEFYKHAEMYGLEYPLAGFRTIEGQRSESLNEYKKEAIAALEKLRDHFNWKETLLSKLRYGTIQKIASKSKRISRKFPKNIWYEGARIYNKTPRIAGSNWAIKRRIFVP